MLRKYYSLYHRTLYYTSAPFNAVSKLTRNSKLTIIFIASILSIGLGTFSYIHEGQKFTNAFFNALQTFKLSSNSPKQVTVSFLFAKWLGAVVFVYSIIQVAIGFIKSSINDFYIKLFYRRHFIFCGFSKKTLTLLKNFKENDAYKYVQIIIVEKDKNHDAISEYQYNNNVTVLIGNAEDEEIFKRANVKNAEYVFAFTNNDDINISIASLIERKYEEKTPAIKTRIHLNDFTTLMFFKQFWKGKSDYHAFNAYQLIAQKLIDKNANVFDKIGPESLPAHILVDGLTKQGEYIIYEAAMMYHFLNLQKLTISIVDVDIEKKLNDFINRFPIIKNIVDIIPIDAVKLIGNVHDWENKLINVALCFVCYNDDAKCISQYKTIRQILYTLQHNFNETRVIAILPENTNIGDTKKLFDNIKNIDAKAIGVDICKLYETFKPKSILENFAKNDFLAKRIDFLWELGECENIESKLKLLNEKLMAFGSENERKWTNKTDFEKDMNRYPARHFEIKKRIINLILPDANGNILEKLKQLDLDEKFAKMEHRRWYAEKWLTGFCKGDGDKSLDLIGKKLKANLKYHPDLKEFEELSDKEKIKDFITLDELIFIAHSEKNI